MRDERFDPSNGALEAGLVEDVEDAVPDLVGGRVERVGAEGCVQRVPDGDLVTDDEDPALRPFDQAPQRGRVAAGSLVEALAGRKSLIAPVLMLPRAVVLDGPALE